MQKIAGKVWKKEDKLKQLKSELAALDRKIQLELAPPVPEVAEKENDGQEVKPDTEGVRTVSYTHLYGGFSVCSSTSSFFIGVILRLMFVADGTFPPATAYCFLKVGNAPLSS